MYFKHPEILYALFALIIPVLIHLFQLQRFEKVKFTNVKLLKKVEQKTRKSSQLKKWLILLSRLLLFTALIFAFAQPYTGKDLTEKPSETTIYLDNSLSMQAKGKQGILLQQAIKELYENYRDSEQSITLITNDETFHNYSIDLDLIGLHYAPVQLSLQNILLKIKPNDPSIKQNIFLISDFQKQFADISLSEIDSSAQYSFIQLLPVKRENIAVDSVWIANRTQENISIKSKIKSYGADQKNLNISFYTGDDLQGKSTVGIHKDESTVVNFTTKNTGAVTGRIEINDPGMMFDNRLYFSVPEEKKTKVLIIGKKADFLSKIYTPKEFDLKHTGVKQTDYSDIDKQDLIILNEIKEITSTLISALKKYLTPGKNLVIIPSPETDLISYNQLFTTLNAGKIGEKKTTKNLVTRISYSHPFFKGVFKNQVKNYQYPSVNQHYTSRFYNDSRILGFDDNTAFITRITKNQSRIFWIASPLDKETTNFTDSPLVIPVFYNFSLSSFNAKKISYTIGESNIFEVNTKIKNDEVVHLAKENFDLIPQQITRPDKVVITTTDLPDTPGIYNISLSGRPIGKVAYNYNRNEGKTTYLPVKELVKNKKNIHVFNSVAEAFSVLNEQNKTHNLWQLFIIFALIFLIAEILLQRFLKNQ